MMQYKYLLIYGNAVTIARAARERKKIARVQIRERGAARHASCHMITHPQTHVITT